MCLGDGDSGGPVVCPINDVDTVVAIQTHGAPAGTPCGPDTPDVGVKINKGVIEWIEAVKLEKSRKEWRPYYLMMAIGAIGVFLHYYM